jgi:nucleoside-diphosphate-sugar epimerase
LKVKTASRVLITGSTGFIGRQLLNLIDGKEFQIIASGRGFRPKWLKSDIEWLSGDLLCLKSRSEIVKEARATHLVHLAWFTESGAFWQSKINLDWVSATLDLVKQFHTEGGKHIVCSGSCAEYDWNDEVLSEDHTKLSAQSLFGVSKASCCRILMKYAETYNLTLGWGRIFFVYGPREHPSRLVPTVINKLKNGQKVSVTKGLQKRDYLHVTDVARCFEKMLRAKYHGAVNVGSGEPKAIRQIIETIEGNFGLENLVEYGAIPERVGDPKLLSADTTKVEKDLGFKPTVSLEKGIVETVKHILGDDSY